MTTQPGKPTVVCLCGSTRFGDAYRDAARAETLAGRIVLSVGLLGHAEGIDMGGPVKAMLDELHLRKIDLADEVLVLNVPSLKCNRCGAWNLDHVCGCPLTTSSRSLVPYVGESTWREIAYARLVGKRVRFLHPPEEGM